MGLYKAIGIYYVGDDGKSPAINWRHCIGKYDIPLTKDPQKILDILFENAYHDNVPKEFVIE